MPQAPCLQALCLQACDALGQPLAHAPTPHWGPHLAWALTPAGLPTLLGGGGFVQPPHDGAVEIGYFCLPTHQRQGWGRLIAAALVQQAWGWDACLTILAQTTKSDHIASPSPSARLLVKLGFLIELQLTDLVSWRLRPRQETGIATSQLLNGPMIAQ